MKKILALIFTLGLVFGVGSEVVNTTTNLADGSTTTTQSTDGGYTTYGNPPVGG
jgi:hypothetical protein